MSQALGRIVKSNFILIFVTMLVGAFVSFIAYADTPATMPDLPVSPDFLDFLVASFNGIKGASIFGAAAIMIQLIIKALDQPFANHFFGKRSGLNKLLIVSGLTFAVTPIGLISGAGLTVSAALVHSSTLASFMVFLNQLYKQAVEQKASADLKKQLDRIPK